MKKCVTASTILLAGLLTAGTFLASCASSKGVQSAPAEGPVAAQAAPAAEVPAPAPVLVEVPYWVLNRVETAYPDGVVSGVETFDLDASGRVLKNVSFDGKGNAVSVKTWTWDRDTATMVTADPEGSVIAKGRQTWSQGLLMEEVRLNAKDEVQSTESYRYDAEGRKIGWSVQTAKGNTITTEYEWEGSRLASIRVKDATGAVIKRYTRTYDGSGLLLSESEWDERGTLTRKIAYVYEGGFLVREEARNGSGGMLSSAEYVNDEWGNPLSVAYKDRTGRIIETKKQGWTGYTRLEPQK